MQVKRALWAGGIQRANKSPEKMNTPGLQKWEDLVSSSQLKQCGNLLSCVTAALVLINSTQTNALLFDVCTAKPDCVLY